MITNKCETVKSSEEQSLLATILKGGTRRYDWDVDTEYQPVEDFPTEPLTVQIAGEILTLSEDGVEDVLGTIYKLYNHPHSKSKLTGYETFTVPFAPMQPFVDEGVEWRQVDEPPTKGDSIKFPVWFFSSLKDIEFLFQDVDIYKRYVLPNLDEKRRIHVKHGVRGIRLPIQMYLPDGNGKMRWHTVSMDITDISAEQGAGGLKMYGMNAGLKMTAKDTFTKSEKSRMSQMILERPDDFTDYAKGDVITEDDELVLRTIHKNTQHFYNEIATSIGVDDRPKWGMSTGQIVASMVTGWIAKHPSVAKGIQQACENLNKSQKPNKQGETPERWTPDKLLHRATLLAGMNGLAIASKLDRNKQFGTYGIQCDGGRAVMAAPDTYAEGVLVDIDIDGCYGNGLCNQIFALGNPSIIAEPMTLREAVSIIKSRCIPGLWYGRISWKNAPFKQDVLLSKVEQKYTKWDNGVTIDEEDGLEFVDGDKLDLVFDASMVLTENSVSNAALTHDLLQLLLPAQQGGSSHQSEWAWLLDNAIVNCLLFYDKADEIKKVTPEMFSTTIFDKATKNNGGYSKKWVRVDLKELVKPLIAERKTKKKGTPMNTFIKLIINTIYGCMASQYFSEEGTGVSHLVVGNNITARARALAWMMEKGLGTRMSVTDGGVFDVNKVVFWRHKSLNNMCLLVRGVSEVSKNKIYDRQPLMGEVLTEIGWTKDKDGNDIPDLKPIDTAAWNHVKSQFPNMDICKLNQYSFESKHWCEAIAHHSKVDYCLYNVNGVVGKNKIALRGVPKVENEKGLWVTHPDAQKLFDAVRDNNPVGIALHESRMLSLKEWRGTELEDIEGQLISVPSKYQRAGLLPHDQISEHLEWYSHTPLGTRYDDMKHYNRVMEAYESAKGAIERLDDGRIVKENDPFKVKHPDKFTTKEMLKDKRLPLEVRVRLVAEVA